ncbi:MAG: ABC transporter permease, partial [Prevotella sp.]|nr:ABC transporter permease [Prevotella sp.]
MTYRRIVNYLVLALIVAQIALVLVSWLVTAAWPELPMHSLLSSGGIRWLFASLTQNLLTPVLVWLMFGCMAYGVLRESSLLSLRRHVIVSAISILPS